MNIIILGFRSVEVQITEVWMSDFLLYIADEVTETW